MKRATLRAAAFTVLLLCAPARARASECYSGWCGLEGVMPPLVIVTVTYVGAAALTSIAAGIAGIAESDRDWALVGLCTGIGAILGGVVMMQAPDHRASLQGTARDLGPVAVGIGIGGALVSLFGLSVALRVQRPGVQVVPVVGETPSGDTHVGVQLGFAF